MAQVAAKHRVLSTPVDDWRRRSHQLLAFAESRVVWGIGSRTGHRPGLEGRLPQEAICPFRLSPSPFMPVVLVSLLTAPH